MGPYPKGVSDTYYQQESARCEGYTFDYRKTKAAWYRQWVELPQGVEGKNMVLTFDAVSKVAEVFINGELASSHIGMFGEFQVDGSKWLKPGKNLIVVKVTRDFIKDINDADKIVDVAVTVPVTNKMLKDIAHDPFIRAIVNEKLKRMVYRDRSHPSLVIFNLINEFGGRLSRDKELVAKRMNDMGCTASHTKRRYCYLYQL